MLWQRLRRTHSRSRSRQELSIVLRTDDTTLAVGVNADQKLLIRELSGPDGWNWTTDPSVFPLLERVDVAGVQISPVWTHSPAT